LGKSLVLSDITLLSLKPPRIMVLSGTINGLRDAVVYIDMNIYMRLLVIGDVMIKSVKIGFECQL
jgi:hypothetical protein